MKLWEVHSLKLNGAIRTTPDGEADIDGLVLSEKAYLVVVRDYRPAELVEMVRAQGAEKVADNLVCHFAEPSKDPHNPVSRPLARCRSRIGGTAIVRSDELGIEREVLRTVV